MKNSKKVAAPERMCVICKGRFAKSVLARHILASTGILQLDDKKNLPGRGYYCCSNEKCLAKFALWKPKRRFAKGLGR